MLTKFFKNLLENIRANILDTTRQNLFENILKNSLRKNLRSISLEEVVDAQVTPVVVVHILVQGSRLKPVLATPPLGLPPSIATLPQ